MISTYRPLDSYKYIRTHVALREGTSGVVYKKMLANLNLMEFLLLSHDCLISTGPVVFKDFLSFSENDLCMQ